MTKKYRLGTKTKTGLIRAVTLEGKRVSVTKVTLSEHPERYFVNRKKQQYALRLPEIRTNKVKRAVNQIKKGRWENLAMHYYQTDETIEEKVRQLKEYIQITQYHTDSQRIGLMKAFETRIEQIGQKIEDTSMDRVLMSLGIDTYNYRDANGEYDTVAIASDMMTAMSRLNGLDWDMWYWSIRNDIEETFRYEPRL